MVVKIQILVSFVTTPCRLLVGYNLPDYTRFTDSSPTRPIFPVKLYNEIRQVIIKCTNWF